MNIELNHLQNLERLLLLVVVAVSPNILRQAVTVASVKTLEKPEYQANDSGTKSTIFGSNRA